MTTQNCRTPGLRLALAPIALLAFGMPALADDKTQTVDAGGLTFEAPASWKSSKPESQMRRAQLKVAPVEGDTDGAELVVFAFPGGAGGVEANVDRWQKSFKDKDGNNPKAEVTTVKGKNVEVTRVEMSGHYYPTTFPGQAKQADKPNSRLVAGIVGADDTGYFLRLVGSDKTVSAAKADFDKLLASIKAGGK